MSGDRDTLSSNGSSRWDLPTSQWRARMACRRGEGVMSDDVTDNVLIDVSGVALTELVDEVDQSSLVLALDRIFASQHDAGHYGFNNSI